MDLKVFNRHVIGASHIKSNQPCEDYSLSYIKDGCGIAVVSDGHGSSRSFRASKGAEFACIVVMEILSSYIGKDEEILTAIAASEEKFFFNLKAYILRSWIDRISDDHSQNPFSSEELDGAGEKGRKYYSDNPDGFTKAYGCTLVAAYATTTFWFGIQIGDGTCTVSYEKGLSLQPLPEGPGQIANYTNSLCQSKAIENFVHYFEKKTPLGIFVATDGVDESYQPLMYSLQLPRFYREISRCFFENSPIALDELHLKLEQLTEEGSGDDVSVSAIISGLTPLDEPVPTQEQWRNLLSRTEMEIEDKKLSLENKYKALQQNEAAYIDKQNVQAEAEISRIKNIIANNENALNELLESKEYIERQLSAHCERQQCL